MMALELNNIETNHNIKKMVHDLRSPLACLEMITRFSKKTVEEEKEQLLHLIDRMKRTMGAFVSTPKSVDSKDIPELIDIVEKMILEKQLEYSRLIPEIDFRNPQNINKLDISCCKGDLERMLSNILNNSIESVDNKLPEINITLEVNDNQANISIEDNGRGIPENILNQINNAKSITYGKANGQGLGLVQVRETMSKCNGKFTISSEQNIGTKIILSFKLEN